MTDRATTPNALARRLGVKPQKVLAWIARGELRAVNLADHTGGRPRWKILPEALAEFFASRQSSPAPAPRRRKRRLPGPAKEYV